MAAAVVVRVGLLSFLPVHAAGHHDTRFDTVPQTVLDRVVSSYTPTIRTLPYARRARPPDGGGAADREGRVVVAMPHTPDASDLPGMNAEVTLLRRHFLGRVSTLVRAEATAGTPTGTTSQSWGSIR